MDDLSTRLRRDEDRRDEDATAASTAHDVATVPRHLYTLTVEKVGALLDSYGVDRDVRTIQRWCKSGKIKAIFDPEHADRYLIEPSSVDDIIATLLEEKRRHEATLAAASRQVVDGAATATDRVAATDDPPRNSGRDTSERVAATDDDVATTVSERRDEAATDEVSRLRAEVAMLRGDVQVRQQMVEYMTGQFEKTMDVALERSQQLGMMEERVRVLEADNARLQGQLPAPGEAPSQPPISFHPRSIGYREDGENPTERPAPHGV